MTTNFFAELPTKLPEELVENLLQTESVRLERIVSTGQCSPPGFWYDQDENEWVILLRGSAVLEFQDKTEPCPMFPGDYLLIPAHRKHRVAQTSKEEPTVWLALFFKTNLGRAVTP